MSIDWSRIAEPQTDHYDIKIVLEMSRLLPLPRFRPPRDTTQKIFDGQVAVHHISTVSDAHPRFVPAPSDHPNIAAAVEIVRCWPSAFRGFQQLMTTLSPMLDRETPESSEPAGSSSTSSEQFFGAMWATVYDPLGLAQAFVHEMAHNKLFGLGIFFESATSMITNEEDEVFESPIRKDKLRPMTAVFHAEYSFIHVTALDILAVESGVGDENRSRWLELLARNVPRMEEGLDVIRRNAQLDRAGRIFMDGFYRWAESVLEHGNRLLGEYRVTYSLQ